MYAKQNAKYLNVYFQELAFSASALKKKYIYPGVNGGHFPPRVNIFFSA
jgi:hypothetical protein